MVRIAQPLLAALFVTVFSHLGEARDLKVFRKGKVSLVDETQFNNPTDYNFDEDLQKPADFDNAYDEIVPGLPRFHLVKNGKVAGFTKISIVTRPGSHWSTPRPVTKKGDQYKTWGTPYIIPITKPPRRFETKVRSESVKVEEVRPPTQREETKEITTTMQASTTAESTTTPPSTATTTTVTAPTAAASTTKAPTTATSTTEAPTTRASAVAQNSVFVKFENKFAQRFGVNRVVPQSATTPQPSIVINEIFANSNPLVSGGFPHSAQQKVRSNQVILEPTRKSEPQPLRSRPAVPSVVELPLAPAPDHGLLRPVPIAHPTPSHPRTAPSTTSEPQTTTTPVSTTSTTTTPSPSSVAFTAATTRVFRTRNPALGPAARSLQSFITAAHPTTAPPSIAESSIQSKTAGRTRAPTLRVASRCPDSPRTGAAAARTKWRDATRTDAPLDSCTFANLARQRASHSSPPLAQIIITASC